MKLREKSQSHEAKRSLNTGIDSLRAYRASGDAQYLERANREFHIAFKSDPEYLPALYFQSVTCDLLGKQDAAIDGLKQVLEARPKFADEVQLNLGIAYFHKYHRSDLTQAEELFEKIIHAPKSNALIRVVAKASLAQVWAQMMIQTNPQEPDRSAIKNTLTRVQTLVDDVRNEASSAAPDYQREILWRVENALGLSLMFASDYDVFAEDGRFYFLPLINAGDSSAVLRFRLQQIDRALEHFAKANHISPRNWAVLCNLGSAFMRRGYWAKKAGDFDLSSSSFREAEHRLHQVIDDVRKDYAFAHYELGRLLRLSDRYEAAIQEFELCLKVSETQRDVSNRTIERERERAERDSDIFP